MPSSRSLDEETALLSLVQESEGTAWSTSLKGWSHDSGVPVCEWEGVTCRIGMATTPDSPGPGPGEEVVAEISLEAKGLSGTIPTELGSLSGLEHLSLKNNILRGSIPLELAALSKLVTLDLTECFLTGTLPQVFQSSHLTTLLLANNAISGNFFAIDDAPQLRSIEEIRMENNLLTGTLHGPSLARMPRLETLSLSANDLSGLVPGEELGSLPALHYLYLDSNHFVGPLPGQLAQVGRSQILELWVQDNALSGTVPASYVRFDGLHDFFVDGNKLTGALPLDLCGPEINSDFFTEAPPEAERNYCDSIACPAGSVAFEGVYPCERCPGGEAARLKNRYLGQTGECSNYTQRDVLKIFHRATTKGGAWTGVSDWDDEDRPVCDMTGIACDAHGNVVGIGLKNRRLEGHIPDEIGHLSFLESFDVSDNGLMGYVPGDLRWTSVTRLDVSGNRMRGVVPPLLCMKEGLNGNGEENVFYCDRIACPGGTYNRYGYHHGVRGEECVPCYDGTTFVAQKACRITEEPGKGGGGGGGGIGGPKLLRMAARAKEETGLSSGAVLGVIVGVLFGAVAFCWAVGWAMSHAMRPSPPSKRDTAGRARGDAIRRKNSSFDYKDDEAGEDDDADDYSFNLPGHPRYRDVAYRDFAIADDNANGEDSSADGGSGADSSFDTDDDNMSRATTRSATELVSEHRGVALTRGARLKKAVSGRVMSGDLGRRARGAASTINVGARRLNSQRKREGGSRDSEAYRYVDDDGGNEEGSLFRADLELASNSNDSSSSGRAGGGDAVSSPKPERNMPTPERSIYRGKQLQPEDLLDVPMIT